MQPCTMAWRQGSPWGPKSALVPPRSPHANNLASAPLETNRALPKKSQHSIRRAQKLRTVVLHCLQSRKPQRRGATPAAQRPRCRYLKTKELTLNLHVGDLPAVLLTEASTTMNKGFHGWTSSGPCPYWPFTPCRHFLLKSVKLPCCGRNQPCKF